ncbi:MAG: carbohydrate porin [Polaromonas sp.]|nr:carbohydrate porin [Polaromonas sp.]
MKHTLSISAIAVAAALCASGVHADDGTFEFHGYSRGGPVLSTSDGIKGRFQLGGDTQGYRLGNEGDNGIEIDLSKTFKTDGANYKIEYMPAKWNSGNVGTEQAFVEISGMGFAPEAKFWVGQRRLRIQDVHIVDYFLMNYGDNQGAGVTDIPIGGAKLGLGVFTGDKFDTAAVAGVNATRFNADISEIGINPGGKLRVLMTGVNGSGLADTNTGAGISVSHNQSDFLTKGLNNALFLQTSSGHARIDGEFEGIDGVAGGKKVTRIADSLSWQLGAFGGQTLLAYQINKDERTGVETKDTSIGGRISYAFSKNFKLLVDAATTTRTGNGPDQRLDKLTIAPTLSVGPDFYARPELRLYVTMANWNDAAAVANATSFGAGGKTARTVAGIQYEMWW